MWRWRWHRCGEGERRRCADRKRSQQIRRNSADCPKLPPIILQNFYGTLIVDTIGIGLAAAGMLNPLIAAFIHVASELTFILNSTRLLPSRWVGYVPPFRMARKSS